MRRLIIGMAAGLVSAFLLLGAANAEDEEVETGTGPEWFNAELEVETSVDAIAVESTATVGQTTYSYQPACVRGEGISGQDFYGCAEQLECGRKGQLWTVWAHHPDGSTENFGEQCFQPDEAPAVATVTADAVLRAFRRIPVPASEVSIQPPGGETLVNLDTVFSTEADSFTRTIGLLGHRVELDIRPSQFRWVSGDGGTQVTDWAGKPWQRGTPLEELITHRYEQADRALRPRVDTVWTARYRVDGGAWQDVGGTVTITGEAFDLAVLSAAPHLSG